MAFVQYKLTCLLSPDSAIKLQVVNDFSWKCRKAYTVDQENLIRFLRTLGCDVGSFFMCAYLQHRVLITFTRGCRGFNCPSDLLPRMTSPKPVYLWFWSICLWSRPVWLWCLWCEVLILLICCNTGLFAMVCNSNTLRCAVGLSCTLALDELQVLATQLCCWTCQCLLDCSCTQLSVSPGLIPTLG